MRLPNVKTLLCWPSRIQIYGFVENHTFLEQFVSMGVPAHFSIVQKLEIEKRKAKLGKHEPYSTLWFPPGRRRIRQRNYSERSEAITSRGWDSPSAQRDLVGRI